MANKWQAAVKAAQRKQFGGLFDKMAKQVLGQYIVMAKQVPNGHK